MACVTYLGWDGGRVGSWLRRRSRCSPGASRISRRWPSPAGCRPDHAAGREAPSALNAGAALLLGLCCSRSPPARPASGPTHPLRHGYFNHHFMTEHGGAGGEALYWASTSLFQRLGAHILTVLMFVSGVLLFTQTTLSSVLARAGEAARRARLRPASWRRRRERRGLSTRCRRGDAADPPSRRANPTETADTRARRGRRGWLTSPTEETSEPASSTRRGAGRRRGGGRRAGGAAGRAASRPSRGAAGGAGARDDPHGRQAQRGSPSPRRSTTSCPPRASFSSGARATRGRTRATVTTVAKALLESLRHFNVEARLTRRRQRAAREPLRAAARAGDEGRQGRPAQGRPRLRACVDRHPHPRSDPGEEGGGRRGAERSAGAWSASATSTPAGPRAPRRSSSGWARTSPGRPPGPTSR